MEESEAIAQLKRGDLQGLEELVQRHQVEAVQTAYLIIGDRGLAEDVVQDAFLKVAGKIHQFKDGLPFRPWFLRIVANDAVKASTRVTRQVSLDASLESGVHADRFRDPGPSPEEIIAIEEERQQVWEALQLLTPKQRSAIVMRYFLEMRGPQISESLGRSINAIKWSIHAAKKRLRPILSMRDASGERRSSEGDSKSETGVDR